MGLPILGWLPGVPLRLSVVWLWVASSMLVVACGMVSHDVPRPPARIFGWMALVSVGVALVWWRQSTVAFVWASQVVLVLAASWQLNRHGACRWLKEVVIACALLQIVVWSLQRLSIPNPWPTHVWTKQGWGTVGSATPAAVVLAVACLWSRGWRSWLWGSLTLLTGSGTVLSLLACRLWLWLRGRLPRWSWVSLGAAAASIGLWLWRDAWMMRWQVWREAAWSWWGIGFKAFPGGFGDDTAIGQAMRWRDYHNTYLDWIIRFGWVGLASLLALGWWLWRNSRQDAAWRWTFALALWVGCWQSVEQFPALGLLLLVWMIGVAQHAQKEPDALDSV